MGADFSGYATKTGLKCSDGRTIMPDAFKHCDGQKVPLVWQHGHNEPGNVLGHAMLEARKDGVYAYAFFNGTEPAQQAKTLVQHGDITALSIYANKLVEKSKQVFHGQIREVSLVLSGANPGALIDNVSIAHSDGEIEDLDDEAIIYTGLTLEHADMDEDEDEEDDLEHAEDGRTVKDVYDSLTEEQKNVVHFMIGAALEEAGGDAQHSDFNNEGDLNHQEGNDDMSRNVFEQNGGQTAAHALSHEDVKGIVADAMKNGSLKDAVENYALQHGIENIEILFPDAKAITDRPEFDKRRTEWVAGVMNGTRHTPFSRIKSLTADLTYDDARAKGYIKGNFKKEEFFAVSGRVTTPTTVYKKQKLDRDDMIDIVDFDVVAWLKAEMRMMLEEELARAVLIGDGRAVDDEDKIKDPAGSTEGAGIRSIANEHELYATTVRVNIDDADSDLSEVVDAVLRSRVHYKGTGTPTFYTTEEILTGMLLTRDKMGRRMYRNVAELADELRVSTIVPVEAMEGQGDLLGIIVNLADYTIGADKGGEVNTFDDFDIDYNKYKYLIETRVSGALTKIKSALIIRSTGATDVLVAPKRPAFDSATNTITIPAITGVEYKIGSTVQAAGPVVIIRNTKVTASPTAGHFFENDAEDEWTYTFKTA